MAALSLCSGKDVHGLVFSGKRSLMKSHGIGHGIGVYISICVRIGVFIDIGFGFGDRFGFSACVDVGIGEGLGAGAGTEMMRCSRSLEIVPLTPRLKRMMCHWKNDSCANNDEQRSGRESKSLDFDKRC